MTASRARWLLALLSTLGPAAHAGVDLHLTLDVHVEGGPQAAPPDRHESLDATLGDTWIVLRNGPRTVVFDFDKRRRTVIDGKTRTRIDYSLYDTAGFRTMELASRQGLAQALSKAPGAPGQAVPDLVDTEHALSIQERPSTPLRVGADGADTVFSNGATPLMRVSAKGTPVAPAQSRMFAQFVRYAVGAHPQILDALARSNAIPEALMDTVHGLVTATTTIRIDRVRASAAGPIDVAAIPLQSVDASQPPLAQVLARGAALTRDDAIAGRERLRERVDDDFRAARPFDAFLGMMEWSISTGEPAPPLDAARTAALGGDPSVAALRAALAQQSPDAPARLEALRPRSASHGYMIDLLVADDRALLGDRAGALQGLEALLQAHPLLAGAYKDLGDDLLASFDAPDAWRSWDIGRRLAPGFANFDAVTRFERQLVADHPEYF